MNRNDNVAPVLRFIIDCIYALGAASSLLIVTYIVFFIAEIMFVAPGLLLIGAAYGMIVIAICTKYLISMLRLLSSTHWQQRRYDGWIWLGALLGAVALWGMALVLAGIGALRYL